MEQAAKRLVTINIHRGLFQYDRLPFKVAPTPAIFQREMESLLSSCKTVHVIYFDDVLVTGITEEETVGAWRQS